MKNNNNDDEQAQICLKINSLSFFFSIIYQVTLVAKNSVKKLNYVTNPYDNVKISKANNQREQNRKCWNYCYRCKNYKTLDKINFEKFA